MITLDDIDAIALPRAEVYQLTSDAEGDDTQRNMRIDYAIAYATAEVESAFNDAGVTLPEDLTVLKNIAVDIAVYRMFTRRSGEIPKTHQQRYDNSMIALRDIVKRLSVNDSDDSSPSIASFTRKPTLINRIDAMPS